MLVPKPNSAPRPNKRRGELERSVEAARRRLDDDLRSDIEVLIRRLKTEEFVERRVCVHPAMTTANGERDDGVRTVPVPRRKRRSATADHSATHQRARFAARVTSHSSARMILLMCRAPAMLKAASPW